MPNPPENPADGPAPAPGLSLVGHLLVASPRLTEETFAKTVVLIVRHELDLGGGAGAGDGAGAFGLVLNRPSGLTVGEAIAAGADEADEDGGPALAALGAGADAPLFHGGPCGGPLMALHADRPAALDEDGDESAAVLRGVWYTISRPRIESLLRGDSPAAVKYVAGYAGWGPGQLEAEIVAGGWRVLAASAADALDPAADERKWSRLTAGLALSPWIDPSRIPEDPRVN